MWTSVSLQHIPIIVPSEYLLIFYNYNPVEAHLVYSLPQFLNQLFLQAVLYFKNFVLETKFCTLDVLIVSLLLLLLGPISGQSLGIYTYVH